MCKRLADLFELVEGEKALYMDEIGSLATYLKVVSVTEVFNDGDGTIIVKCAEFDERVLPRDLYSKEKIMRMLGNDEDGERI